MKKLQARLKRILKGASYVRINVNTLVHMEFNTENIEVNTYCNNEMLVVEDTTSFASLRLHKNEEWTLTREKKGFYTLEDKLGTLIFIHLEK